MHNQPPTTAAKTITDALNEMRQQISSLMADRKDSQFQICAVEVESADLLSFVEGVDSEQLGYFRSRDRSIEIASVGAADRQFVHDGDDIARFMDRLSTRLPFDGPAYIGGLQFNRARKDADWPQYGMGQFVLPRLQLMRIGDSNPLCYCTVNRAVDSTDSVLDELDKLMRQTTRQKTNAQYANMIHTPTYDDWSAAIDSALDLMHRSVVEKIALARQTSYDLDAEFDSLRLLRGLLTEATDCYHFLFQPERSTSFVGASPERLFLRSGRQIESEALAGTIQRDTYANGDAALQLLESEKDRREQEIVSEFMQTELGRLCVRLKQAPTPTVRKLARLMHLVTTFEGELRESVSDGDLLSALHPTPAVGASPRSQLWELLPALEDWQRGWYAGPIGYVTKERTEFAVALRCALIEDATLHLFAGAGIVYGSTADAEWREMDAKLQTMRSVLGC
jgi:menaquinone-specific isochorismate synthase